MGAQVRWDFKGNVAISKEEGHCQCQSWACRYHLSGDWLLHPVTASRLWRCVGPPPCGHQNSERIFVVILSRHIGHSSRPRLLEHTLAVSLHTQPV